MADTSLTAMLNRFGVPQVDWREEAAEVFAADCEVCAALLEQPETLPAGMLRQITLNQRGWLRFWARHHRDILFCFECAAAAAAIEPLITGNNDRSARQLARHKERSGVWRSSN